MKQFSPASDAPSPTHTAVIVPVPAAGLLVDEHRRQFDVAASWGVPAHVSVLYPFVEPAQVDGHLVETLAAVFDSAPAFDCRFSRTNWFGRDVLWLDPEPAQPFRDLTAAVWAAFPENPPYAGAHEGVVPHLTIAKSRLGSLTAVQRAEQAVREGLPLSARVETVLLIAGTKAPNSWRILHEFRLGTARDVTR